MRPRRRARLERRCAREGRNHDATRLGLPPRVYDRTTVVADDTILVDELSAFSEPRGAPISADLAPLLVRPAELPVAEQVVEVALVPVVQRFSLLVGLLRGDRQRNQKDQADETRALDRCWHEGPQFWLGAR